MLYYTNTTLRLNSIIVQLLIYDLCTTYLDVPAPAENPRKTCDAFRWTGSDEASQTCVYNLRRIYTSLLSPNDFVSNHEYLFLGRYFSYARVLSYLETGRYLFKN